MKREIKFRGRDCDGKWNIGDLIHEGDVPCILSPVNDGIPLKVDPDTIGQFTGLTDHNGKEIYEGDLLECPRVPAIPLEVYYNSSKGAFFLAEHTHTEGVLKGTTTIGKMLIYYPKLYIIGNIYDNPIEK